MMRLSGKFNLAKKKPFGISVQAKVKQQYALCPINYSHRICLLY